MLLKKTYSNMLEVKVCIMVNGPFYCVKILIYSALLLLYSKYAGCILVLIYFLISHKHIVPLFYVENVAYNGNKFKKNIQKYAS